MHPFLLFLILVAAAGAIHVHPAAAGTRAARFWEETLPGSPMPKAIADLVQQGTGHSPLVDNHTLPNILNKPIYTILYNVGSFPNMPAVPEGLFFLMAQVLVGTTMTVSFPPVALPAILPRDAEKIPFGHLADVLSRFNITASSTEAAKVGDTLSRCQAPALAGEQKACSTSLEATVESAMRMLGATSRAWAVASSALPRAGLPPQPYVIQAVRLLDGDRHVGCHRMPYPYAVYHCHTTGRPTKAYVISLRGLHKGPAVALAAICHLNTSSWNPAYPAFKILHTRPGGAPVCHFMLYGDLVFGEKASNA